MNVLSCKRIIDAVSADFSAQYPWVDRDDFRGECWLEVYKAKDLWTVGGCSFTSFVYKRVGWLKQQWIRNHSRRVEIAKDYAARMNPLEVNDLPYDESARWAIRKLEKTFTEEDWRLCELYLNPSDDFLRFVESERSDRSTPSDKRVTNDHFAKFLGKTRSWVEWRLRDIRTRLRSILSEESA